MEVIVIAREMTADPQFGALERELIAWYAPEAGTRKCRGEVHYNSLALFLQHGILVVTQHRCLPSG